MKSRIEKDSMGVVEVPIKAKWGAQTQRACLNFPISGYVMPEEFIQALGYVKYCAAEANNELELLDKNIAIAIMSSAKKIIDGLHVKEFPVDVFQTGSGTSSNMNANEVIATLSHETFEIDVHPNDHVNMGQSSNDVIPTTIAVATVMSFEKNLKPHVEHLIQTLKSKAQSLEDITKTGRTHLMDAMPVTFSQELMTWVKQLEYALNSLCRIVEDLKPLAQGGTAVGTGINVHPDFPKIFCEKLAESTGIAFKPSEHFFELISAQDRVAMYSGALKTLSITMMKISNDLRWMNSGPLAGLGEIALPALQPGSSIMPGKVNPVIPESAAMVCAHVMGTDQTVTIAAQSGNFQLNVMLPIIAYHVLENTRLLGTTCVNLADKAIEGFVVNIDNIKSALDKNPILVTALNRVIGYEKGADIAKKAYSEKRSVLEVASEMTSLSIEELSQILDPHKLTQGGL